MSWIFWNKRPANSWDDLLIWWRAQEPRHTRRIDGVVTTDQNALNRCEFELRQRIAPFLQAIEPSYSSCERCHWPWNLVLSHTTDIGRGRGCFPLCEQCWRELGHSSSRMPFYRSAWEKYWTSEPWGLYEAAVLAEDAVGSLLGVE